MGLFSHLKKEEKSKSVRTIYKHIVVGKDFIALKVLEDIIKKYGEESVKLITFDEIKQHDLFYTGPNLVRGENNINFINKLYPHLLSSSHSNPSKFIKEQGIYPFKGRTKPGNQLLFREDYFVDEGVELSLGSFFEKDVNDILYQHKNLIIQAGLKSIDWEEKENRKYWRLELITGQVLGAENLFFGASPLLFSKLLQNKSLFPNEFYEFCQKIKNQYSLIYQGESRSLVSKEMGTLFIPQVVSLEKGHFIGEFSPYDEMNNSQRFTFLMFLDESEEDAEEISKKIKLLKRTLKRIFPEFGKARLIENIHVTEQSPCPEVDDQLFQKVASKLSESHLHFIGSKSPLPLELSGLSNTVRAIANYHHVHDHI